MSGLDRVDGRTDIEGTSSAEDRAMGQPRGQPVGRVLAPWEAALVGRSGELAAIELRLAEARAGRGSLVVVHGEAGIGKTAVARRALHLARASGMETGYSRADELGRHRPFGVVLTPAGACGRSRPRGAG